MIPIRDINPSEKPAIVTKALVIINIVIFIVTFFNPAFVSIVSNWGFRPIYLFNMTRLETLFTSMFLHGDIHHIFGNMLFLWIFGDNVEDALGHVNYIIFYLSAGVFAAFLQSIMSVDPYIVMIGASGAISGVLGAYLIFYPRARIVTLVYFFYFITTVVIPAYHYIWIWFVMQFIFGTFSILGAYPTGVAYWAHIGGFIFGVLVGILLRNRYSIRVKREIYYERLGL